MTSFDTDLNDPNARDHGYVCWRCDYIPTNRELDMGSCPGCALQRAQDRHEAQASCSTT